MRALPQTVTVSSETIIDMLATIEALGDYIAGVEGHQLGAQCGCDTKASTWAYSWRGDYQRDILGDPPIGQFDRDPVELAISIRASLQAAELLETHRVKWFRRRALAHRLHAVNMRTAGTVSLAFKQVDEVDLEAAATLEPWALPAGAA